MKCISLDQRLTGNPNKLHEVDITITTQSYCSDAYSPNITIANDMICTGPAPGGIGSCQVNMMLVPGNSMFIAGRYEVRVR